MTKTRTTTWLLLLLLFGSAGLSMGHHRWWHTGGKPRPTQPPAPPPISGGACDQNAASTSYADVNTAVGNATDGQTVCVPAGSSTWDTTLTITNKAITILGAGIGQTNITLGTPNSAVTITTKATGGSPAGFFRFSGFSFATSQNCGTAPPGIIDVNGVSQNLRVDHNAITITHLTCAAIVTHMNFGVFDHNEVTVVGNIAVWNFNESEGKGFGNESWAAADNFGSVTSAVYFEDNIFTSTAAATTVVTDGWRGSRVVFRHNTFNNMGWGNHGAESGRSMRTYELYENDFWLTTTGHFNIAGSRGGTGVFYNNRVHLRNGNTLTHFSLNSFFRATTPSLVGHWWCSCGSYTMSSLTRIDATTARASFTGGPPWSDMHADIEPQCWATVANADIGAYNGTYKIKAATNSSFDYTPSSDPGSDSNCAGSGTCTAKTPFDGNSGSDGYRCMDQEGSGQNSVAIDTDAQGNPSPIGDVQAALSPTYYWNNTIETDGGAPSALSGETGSAVVQENRDFYNATQKPSYTPLVYPHPLVSGTVLAPSGRIFGVHGRRWR